MKNDPKNVAASNVNVEDSADLSPKPLSTADNVIMTIKLLVVAGILLAALWAFERYVG